MLLTVFFGHACACLALDMPLGDVNLLLLCSDLHLSFMAISDFRFPTLFAFFPSLAPAFCLFGRKCEQIANPCPFSFKLISSSFPALFHPVILGLSHRVLTRQMLRAEFDGGPIKVQLLLQLLLQLIFRANLFQEQRVRSEEAFRWKDARSLQLVVMIPHDSFLVVRNKVGPISDSALLLSRGCPDQR